MKWIMRLSRDFVCVCVCKTDLIHARLCQMRVLVCINDSLPLLKEEECKHTQTNSPGHPSLPLFLHLSVRHFYFLSPIAGLQLHSLVFCPSVVIESIFMQGWSRFTFMFKVDTIRPSLAVLYKIIAFKPLQVNTFLVTVIRIDVQI